MRALARRRPARSSASRSTCRIASSSAKTWPRPCAAALRRVRPARQRAGTGVHRARADRGRARHADDVRRACAARRVADHRRFRRGLQRAQLPAPPADPRPQAQPAVPAGRAEQHAPTSRSARPSPASRTASASAWSPKAWKRTRSASSCSRLGVQDRPGLPVRARPDAGRVRRLPASRASALHEMPHALKLSDSPHSNRATTRHGRHHPHRDARVRRERRRASRSTIRKSTG